VETRWWYLAHGPGTARGVDAPKGHFHLGSDALPCDSQYVPVDSPVVAWIEYGVVVSNDPLSLLVHSFAHLQGGAVGELADPGRRVCRGSRLMRLCGSGSVCRLALTHLCCVAATLTQTPKATRFHRFEPIPVATRAH
jgi:hypothetical protein